LAANLLHLDCSGRGRERCYDLAREIVAARSSAEGCVSLYPAVDVKIDGQPMPMNLSIAGIVRRTILGMLSSLKGFKNGMIETRL
jgi:molybdopterin-guanine dinucleotide biosynthesis protein B